MSRPALLSDAAKDYLARYYTIVDNMIGQMTAAIPTDSISRDFIARMIPLRQAAVEMSQNLLRFTTSTALAQAASAIAEEQTEAIADMRRILQACAARHNTRQDLCLYWRQAQSIRSGLFTALENARAQDSVDCSYIGQMIPLQQGIALLSQNALRFDVCPALVPLLEDAASPCQAISQLQRLQRRLGC